MVRKELLKSMKETQLYLRKAGKDRVHGIK
jgi:hypothetical protein